jgi:peptide subunit release factor 1 (eRF1)
MTSALLIQQLDALARRELCHPLLSLYLNTEIDNTGRHHPHHLFVRKALHEAIKGSPERSPERQSLEADRDRIERFLTTELRPSTRGLALFACHRSNLFESLQLSAPFDRHRLNVGDRPHLYPLARVHDQYPRCAAVVMDTHSARIFVFSLGQTEQYVEVQNPKAKHIKAGGWSQARFQRHTQNEHLVHVKEVVERLDAIVAADDIDRFVVAGDEVVVPLFQEQIPLRLAEKLVSVVRLDIRSSESDVLAATLDALRQEDQARDRTVVEDVLGASRAGGRAVTGIVDTRKALREGQVDTLVIAATPRHVPGEDAAADELVTAARQTSASVRFIEDPALLQSAGGVAARLRFLI